MNISEIHYSAKFIKMFEKLPTEIQKKSIQTLELLQQQPFSNSLRLHKLEGKLQQFWSISITMSYRIIFEPQKNGDILLISIGNHSIYQG